MKLTLVVLACLVLIGTGVAVASMARGPRIQVQGPRVPQYRGPVYVVSHPGTGAFTRGTPQRVQRPSPGR